VNPAPETFRPEGASWQPTPDDPLAAFPGLLDCVHCGFCLEACPTYRVRREETESPRGRIALMRAALEGRLPEAEVRGPLERCVLCRACEPACPSSVPWGGLLERWRDRRGPGLAAPLLAVLPRRPLLRLLGLALRLLRALGLLGLAERFGPRRLRALAAAVPPGASGFHPSAGSLLPARPPARGRVRLHLGCIQAELLGGVLRDATRLLRAEGFDIEIPAQPSCCGALHAHSGAGARARELARRTHEAFPGEDPVIVLSAGCLAFLREQDPSFPAADPMVFLQRRGLRSSLQPLPERLAWDPPCHLQNVCREEAEAARLLEALPGVERVAHRGAELCCGAGGISFARQPALSGEVLADKVRALEEAGAEAVATGNAGCLLWLGAGLRRAGSACRAEHPVTTLARRLRERPGPDATRCGASRPGSGAG